jgi:hypothetical protein
MWDKSYSNQYFTVFPSTVLTHRLPLWSELAMWGDTMLDPQSVCEHLMALGMILGPLHILPNA